MSVSEKYSIISNNKDGHVNPCHVTGTNTHQSKDNPVPSFVKGEVHPISPHSKNEGLNNMNTNAQKRFYEKCHKQQKQLCVYLVFGC